MTTPGVVVAFLGKVDIPVQAQPLGKGTGLVLSDLMLIIVIAVALFTLLLLWAKYLRNAKGHKRRSGGQKVYRDSSDSNDESDEPEETSASAESRRRFKYRYRRRSHRSRNPTLAETGGLPPSRTEDSAQSSQ